MRPWFVFSALSLLGFVPASALMAQHHGGHAGFGVMPGVVHPGAVLPGIVHPGMIQGGVIAGGYSPGGGGAGGATQVNVTASYSPTFTSVNNFGGGLRAGYGVYAAGYRPLGYGFYGIWPMMLAPVAMPIAPIMPAPIAPAPGFAAANPAPAPAPAPAAPARKVRVSNAAAKARAGKLIDAGDKLFAAQKYREALERYKSAVTLAPDLAEIFLRQGFAHVAMGQYESAAKDIRRGLKMKPDWRPDELRLAKLYGDELLAKSSHLEALATSLQAAPHDATALYLLGMELYFDGHVERAGPFFVRAAQLGANEDHLLDSFLKATAAANGPLANGPVANAPVANGAGAAAPGAAAGVAPGVGGAPAGKPADRGPILDL